MEKGQWIKDLSERSTAVSGIFAVARAERMVTKSGQDFWKLRLVDKTGSIDGKIWSDFSGVLHPDRLAAGDLVRIQGGKFNEWKGTRQISANAAELVAPESVPARDRAEWFSPPSDYDGERAFDELMALAAEEFASPAWKRVIDGFFGDPARAEAFKSASAAASMHHVGAGGLCVHTLEVFKICRAMAGLYPAMDRQTLLAGALFHDVGKLEEMRNAGFATEYTLAGNLVGHMVLGVQMLKPLLDASGLPEGVAAHFCHLLLSHHGQPEFGAVKAPASMEAFTLHHADMLSSHLNTRERLIGEMQVNEYRRLRGEDPVFRPEKTPEAGGSRKEPAQAAGFAADPPPPPPAASDPAPEHDGDFVPFEYVPAESEPAGAGTADEVPQWLEEAPIPADAPDADWQRLPDGLGEAAAGAEELPAEAMAALAEAGLAVGDGVEPADLSAAFDGTAAPGSSPRPEAAPCPAAGALAEPSDLRFAFDAGRGSGADPAEPAEPADPAAVQGSEALADLQAAFGDAGIDLDASLPALGERSALPEEQGSEDALTGCASAIDGGAAGAEGVSVLVETGASHEDHGSEDALAEASADVGEPAEPAQASLERRTAALAPPLRPEPSRAGEQKIDPEAPPAEAAEQAKAPDPVPEAAPAPAPSAAAGTGRPGKRGRPAQDKEGRGKSEGRGKGKGRGRQPGSLLNL